MTANSWDVETIGNAIERANDLALGVGFSDEQATNVLATVLAAICDGAYEGGLEAGRVVGAREENNRLAHDAKGSEDYYKTVWKDGHAVGQRDALVDLAEWVEKIAGARIKRRIIEEALRRAGSVLPPENGKAVKK